MGCGGSTPVTVKSPPPRTPTPPPPPPRETTADFASDCIDIQIDKGKDENEIQAKEDGYPEPTPSDQVDGRIKPKDKWFEDEDFNNASDDADLFKTEIAVDDDDIDIDTLSDTASYTSNPTRSARPNLLFDDVDNHAKLASSSHLDSFKDLVQYLKKPFENDRFKNMKTARAIVAWMSNRPMDGVDYGVATTDTPRGLMQYLKENRMTYTTCYTILCR
ncbi:uncharacterized protein LOC123535944 [Mercenaria mercenaria]|uniref:uncharacterized protein LOC123535944 n=1 Tax=Mercenaria mercenaria TaxID=6596 RepID=UPI00234E8036|nr:uncharacterized protein LOC123535944 [Mercenaria mercenaria]